MIGPFCYTPKHINILIKSVLKCRLAVFKIMVVQDRHKLESNYLEASSSVYETVLQIRFLCQGAIVRSQIHDVRLLS